MTKMLNCLAMGLGLMGIIVFGYALIDLTGFVVVDMKAAVLVGAFLGGVVTCVGYCVD